MSLFHTILFDLDGTLTDPKIGITKSIQYALKALGIDVDNLDTLLPFIGPPLRDSFKNFCNFNDEQAEEAVAYYREYFGTTGIFENEIYDGIEKLLNDLYNRGKILLLATSKPTVYAKQVLEYFHIDSFFSFVSGSELDGRRSAKDEVIRYALENCAAATNTNTNTNITHDTDSIIMIGDREYDIFGARKNNIKSIGVTYGYGSFDELSGAGASFTVATVKELSELLCQRTESLANQTSLHRA